MTLLSDNDTHNNNFTSVIDPETLTVKRSFQKPEDASRVYRRMVFENKERVYKMARIARKLNNEAPYPQKKLEASGESWRSNRATGFMDTIIKRLTPPYLQIVRQARTLTSAKLKRDDPGSNKKTEDFRVGITRCIRSWKGWNGIVEQILTEDIVYGYSVGVCLDEIEWRPKFFRQDEVFFPDGCPQNADDIPLFCVKEHFQIHELVDILKDVEAAEEAGWDVEKLVKAINTARPENRRTGLTENLRQFEDTIRETTLGNSYREGVKVIEAAHVLVKEPNGAVSHYIVNTRSDDVLYARLDRFENMSDVIAIFTIEVGNGKLQGSRGAGRVLYNTHVQVDQARNQHIDQLNMAGLLFFKGKAGARREAALKVIGPLGIVGEGFELQKNELKPDTEAFLNLDMFLQKLAELQVGAYNPGVTNGAEGGDKSASEVNYAASVEQQLRDGALSRWWQQFQELVHMMQRRICHPLNIVEAKKRYDWEKNTSQVVVSKRKYRMLQMCGEDLTQFTTDQFEDVQGFEQDAIETLIQMFRDGLSASDIYDLAHRPARELSEELAAQDNPAIEAMAQQYAGNPNVDQMELMRLVISSKLGNDLADALIIPNGDQTVQAEAVREQMMEMFPLLTTLPVPVSPRDNDQVHLQTIQNLVEKLLGMIDSQALAPYASMINAAMGNILSHAGQHIQAALHKGSTKEQMEPFIQWLTMLQQQMAQQAGQQAPAPTQQFPANPHAHHAPPAHPRPHGPGKPESETAATVAQLQTNPQPLQPGSGMPLAHTQINTTPNVTGGALQKNTP